MPFVPFVFRCPPSSTFPSGSHRPSRTHCPPCFSLKSKILRWSPGKHIQNHLEPITLASYLIFISIVPRFVSFYRILQLQWATQLWANTSWSILPTWLLERYVYLCSCMTTRPLLIGKRVCSILGGWHQTGRLSPTPSSVRILSSCIM